MPRRRPAYPGHLRFARYTLATVTAALVGFRLYRAAGESTADLITSLSTVTALIGVTAAGYVVRIRQLRDRAETAEWETARLRRSNREREEEERSWWADDTDHDTLAYGPNVVQIAMRRAQPKAG